MGSYRTKEDDVAKISTSVYITNFPESVSAKELFHAYKQYGHVVDSFIPTKRSKNGKRFGFVRPPDKKEGDGVKKTNVFSSPKEYSKANINTGGGMVKQFASLANLKLALGNEGFVDITIKYMGELWVMFEFNSEETINKFRDNVSVASWFSQIIEVATDFEIEGRIAWVEVQGIPFKLWSGNTFSRIATKWGKLLDVDDQEETCFHSKRHVEGESIDKNVDKSEDPFNIYPLLNKNKPMDGSVNKSGSSLKYPPGFTPIDGNGENSIPAEDGMIRNVREVRTGNRDENNDAFSDIRVNSYTKEAGTESLSSSHFKKSELPRTGGSILGLLDEVVKVGQVMGYKMVGCISNMAEIIESQGVKDVYR
nr:nucleotide-binding alpha-beta plait domain-containing protein [Tanacetum cinerariifolium]